MLHRSPARAGLRTLTFTLPLEWAGRASVVGNFNDWMPGRLTLSADGDVARASVELPDDYIAVFRYLGEGDTLEEARRPAPNPGRMSPLVDGSISDRIVRFACR